MLPYGVLTPQLHRVSSYDESGMLSRDGCRRDFQRKSGVANPRLDNHARIFNETPLDRDEQRYESLATSWYVHHRSLGLTWTVGGVCSTGLSTCATKALQAGLSTLSTAAVWTTTRRRSQRSNTRGRRTRPSPSTHTHAEHLDPVDRQRSHGHSDRSRFTTMRRAMAAAHLGPWIRQRCITSRTLIAIPTSRCAWCLHDAAHQLATPGSKHSFDLDP